MRPIDEKIIQLYISENKSLRDIASITKMDRVTVKNILIRNNIAIRSRIESMQDKLSLGDEIENKVLDMYKNGYLPHEISEKLGIGKTTIYRITKKHGLELKGKFGLINRVPAHERVFVKKTADLENAIIDDYKKGLTTYQLEDKYGVSRTFVSRLLAKNNVEAHQLSSLSEEEEKKAIEIYQTTELTAKEVADAFKISKETLYNILKRNNIETRGNNVSPLQGRDAEIVELYKLGESTKVIARKVKSNPSTIEKILKRNDIEMRDASHSKQVYNIDENYFDIIDTEDKAYFLGFLYADGTNSSKKNTVRLGIVDSDVQILKVFSKYLKYGKPLYFSRKKYKDGTYKGKPIYTLSITNKHVSQQLYTLGIVDRKTLVLKFPKWLDKNLYNHFIRGYFDGDGSMSHNFQLAGTESFLSSIQKILMKECQLNKTKFSKLRSIHTMSYGGRLQLIRIRDFIYKDATIYLERKKVKFPC